MSERQRRTKQQQSESSSPRGGARAHEEKSAPPPRRDLPDRAAAPRLWQAGNSAVNQLLKGDGQPLSSETRNEMEGAFRQDFSTVRVHRDAAAESAADALDANAFTQGDDIYLGSDSPAPDSTAGRELLAHELAHVVQQREATKLKDEVSHPGDRSEQAADRAAEQASRGRAVESVPAAALPAVQRKEKPDKTATSVEAEWALRDYFAREMAAQGRKKDLRVTQQVKDAVQIFFNDPFTWLNVQSELNRFGLREPDEFAAALARHLPKTVASSLLARLERLPARPTAPGLFGRVKKLVKETEPGEPEGQKDEPEAGSQKRVEEFMKQTQEAPGGNKPEEKKFPPEPFPFPPKLDVLRAGRIITRLPGAIRGPKPTAKPRPEAQSYPEAESVISEIPRNALTPAQARGTARAGEFAEAQEFARRLAFELDVAQQQKQDTIRMQLGDNYNGVKDRAAMIEAVEKIILLVREALPHHASNVENVDVYFGDRLVTRGRARAAD